MKKTEPKVIDIKPTSKNPARSEKPYILKSKQAVSILKRKHKDIKELDILEGALREYFFTEHPTLQKNDKTLEPQVTDFVKKNITKSVWIYLPWANTLLRTPNEEIYFKLRTARNKDLITKDEQEKYRELRVGVAGLSVGSAIVNALVVTGGPKKMKIADFDTIEISNLNRVHGTVLDIGQNKVHVAARRAWSLDPFMQFELWDKGVDESNLKKFILDPKLDFFIDEMDSIHMKLLARIICKKHKIPLLMATDNGEYEAILDVERYDINPKTKPFHGVLPENTTPEKLKGLSRAEWIETAMKIIDPALMPTRHRESLGKIGKTISGVPQLGTTANIAGSMISYAIRHIVSDPNSLPSGRYMLELKDVG